MAELMNTLLISSGVIVTDNIYTVSRYYDLFELTFSSLLKMRKAWYSRRTVKTEDRFGGVKWKTRSCLLDTLSCRDIVLSPVIFPFISTRYPRHSLILHGRLGI